MLLEKPIHSIDVFSKEKLVASIITEDETQITNSSELGFTVKIGETEILITAEKIEIH